MAVRTSDRPRRIRYMTQAKPKPRTSSTPTLTKVMIAVVDTALHHTGSVSTVT